jgi:hypothetical protein
MLDGAFSCGHNGDFGSGEVTIQEDEQSDQNCLEKESFHLISPLPLG